MKSDIASPSTPRHVDNPVDSMRMSFGDHLEELRSCLIRALIGVALATAVALIFGTKVLEIVFYPLLVVQHANGLQPRLQALGPTDAFTAYMKVSFLTGLIGAMPWVLFQAWRFVSSGLYARERRFALSLTWASTVLFAMGVLFLYYVALPIVLNFFVGFNRSFEHASLTLSPLQRLLIEPPRPSDGALTEAVPARLPILGDDPKEPRPGEAWVNSESRRLCVATTHGVLSAPLEPGAVAPLVFSEFAIDFYITFVLQLALAFGIAFETPLVVCFLAWTGLFSAAAIRRARRYVAFAIVVFAAILTPPDVMSQILLSVPMYLLFELGLLLASFVERSAKATRNAAASG